MPAHAGVVAGPWAGQPSNVICDMAGRRLGGGWLGLQQVKGPGCVSNKVNFASESLKKEARQFISVAADTIF